MSCFQCHCQQKPEDINDNTTSCFYVIIANLADVVVGLGILAEQMVCSSSGNDLVIDVGHIHHAKHLVAKVVLEGEKQVTDQNKMLPEL